MSAEPDPLDALPDGRYFDGTYEWDKEGWTDGEVEWTPLRAPSGMPSRPLAKGLRRVITTYEPAFPETIPLDPEPYGWGDPEDHRSAFVDAHDSVWGYATFMPRQGYSQNLGDYISRNVSDYATPVSAVSDTLTVPPIPEGLCGQRSYDWRETKAHVTNALGGGCVFLTDHEGKHSWQL